MRQELGLELPLVANNVFSYNICQSLMAGSGHQIIPEFNAIHIPFYID
jgi:hypothetical protein